MRDTSQLTDRWVVINVMCVRSFLVHTEFYQPSCNTATSLGHPTLGALC